MRLPIPCLVVLIGPSSAGKSYWAASQFRSDQVVSADGLRALVGESEHDQRASKDAFEVLDLVIDRRLRRGLVTVADSTALDSKRRRAFLSIAQKHGLPCHVVRFDTPASECRDRNRVRDRSVPGPILTSQLTAMASLTSDALIEEGFAAVHDPEAVRLVAPAFVTSRQQEQPMPLTFGLQIPRFAWPGGAAEIGAHLAEVSRAAEEVGFTSLWVMDHFVQIPQVGREWEDMLDSYTTLGFLAAKTRSVRLGTLVTGVTYRNVAHLAKIVATLDVLSEGRAVCGIGAAWFEREHKAYGWDFPPARERLDLLEDALVLLPLMWGKGTPAYRGRVIGVPEAICYPRPLQEKVPILVGGGGERRTLKLVAKHADACNLFGDAAVVKHKLDVLDRHCADAGRARSDIRVTHLSTALVARDEDALDAAVERVRPERVPKERIVANLNAGTVDDHVARFAELAGAGVQHAIVNLPDIDTSDALERFAEVIAAFPADPPEFPGF